MRNFKIDDFRGAGQYIIRNDKGPNEYKDAGFMSTITKKIGWFIGNEKAGREEQRYCLIDLSDGLVTDGYFITKNEKGEKLDISLWKYVCFQNDNFDIRNGLQKLVDYLNNPDLSQEYRFATHEEIIRIVLYQQNRCN